MIGKEIRQERKAKKLTQRQLAILAGLHWRTINTIENESSQGRPETLEKILKALGLKLKIEIEKCTECQELTWRISL